MAATILGIAPAKVRAFLGGEQDVWLSSCRDFFDSPFGTPGSACPTPFWACLGCTNAVITTRKLPALLSFLAHVVEARTRMSAEQWAATYGDAHRVLTEHVLPRFAPAVIAAARAAADADARPRSISLPSCERGDRDRDRHRRPPGCGPRPLPSRRAGSARPAPGRRRRPGPPSRTWPGRRPASRVRRRRLALGWAQTRRNVPPATLVVDFRVVETPMRRLTAKEFLYARLNERVMGIKRSLPVQVARQELYFLLGFFDFLDANECAMPLRAVSQEVLDVYRLRCQAGNLGSGVPIGAAAVANRISIIIRLALCGEFLSQDRLEIVPWRGRSAYVVAGVVEATENATPRIPEPVLGALLRWALFYVEIAATDILAASEELTALEDRLQIPCHAVGPALRLDSNATGCGTGNPRQSGAIGTYQRPLGEGAGVEPRLTRRMAGLPHERHLDSEACRPVLDAAVEELGLELGGLDTAVSI